MLMPYEYLKRLRSDQRGQTIAEYAIMLVLVAIAIAVATPSISTSILGVFTKLTDQLSK